MIIPRPGGLRWRPVVLVALIMLMLALAWLPIGSLLPEQRSNKPQLYVTYALEDADSELLNNLQFDLQQRLEQRHEWRIIDSTEPYIWRLNVTLSQPGQLVIHGELTAPLMETIADTDTRSEQRFKVQGPAEASGALPAQFVKVLIDLVESGEAASTQKQ